MITSIGPYDLVLAAKVAFSSTIVLLMSAIAGDHANPRHVIHCTKAYAAARSRVAYRRVRVREQRDQERLNDHCDRRSNVIPERVGMNSSKYEIAANSIDRGEKAHQPDRICGDAHRASIVS